MGNSDTHNSINAPAGVPGNYVMSDAQSPSQIDPRQIARNIIDHRVNVARGVFVNLVANGKYPVGSELIAENGTVELLVQVQASSWAQADRVTIFGNGREIWSESIGRSIGAQQYQKQITFHPEVDTWYLAKAEGSESMYPVLPKTELGVITPVGFTNPIWVDIDGDGFESELDRAKAILADIGDDVEKLQQIASESDWIMQKQLYALAPKDSKLEKTLIKMFVNSDQEMARTLAYQRLHTIKDEVSIALLKTAEASAPNEQERKLASTYLATLGECNTWLNFARNYVDTSDKQLMAEQIKILSLNRFVRDWHIMAPFPNDQDKGLTTVYAPEKAIDLERPEIGKNGEQIAWQSIQVAADGHINFLNYYDNFDYCVAYAYTVVKSAEDMETVLLFGSDDGAAVWQDGKQVYYRFIRRGAHPAQEIIPIRLNKGENHFLVKVENAGGGSGFYFELLDPCEKLGY
jgi:hypothetical protein